MNRRSDVNELRATCSLLFAFRSSGRSVSRAPTIGDSHARVHGKLQLSFEKKSLATARTYVRVSDPHTVSTPVPSGCCRCETRADCFRSAPRSTLREHRHIVVREPRYHGGSHAASGVSRTSSARQLIARSAAVVPNVRARRVPQLSVPTALARSLEPSAIP